MNVTHCYTKVFNLFGALFAHIVMRIVWAVDLFQIVQKNFLNLWRSIDHLGYEFMKIEKSLFSR